AGADQCRAHNGLWSRGLPRLRGGNQTRYESQLCRWSRFRHGTGGVGMSTEIAQKASLQVDLAPNNPRELVLRNPVIPASGCFGYGQEYSHVIDIQRLGAFCSKGITMQHRAGNPMPRITETPAGMLNAI